MFEIDRAVKALLSKYPEKCLDLFFGQKRSVVFQGVEDPQINIPERRADKVWLISDHGRNVAVHIEAMLEPKRRELGNFKTKNALLEEALKRPVVTVILYLEKGKYETFPYIYETQAGLLKNSHVFARILLWEHKDRILSGKLKELAPFLSLFEDKPKVSLLEREKELIAQFPDEQRRELMGVAILVACRKFQEELVREIFKEQLPMVKEISFVREWLEDSEQKGRQEGKRALLLTLLAKKFGKLSPQLQKQIRQLSGTKLDNLSLALLDLKNVKELKSWLANGKTTRSAN
ncbi:MAG: DUF4351 domain-containing protein [candidate division KSB1 bacterium]|nr:DUF4351 domain-containing protein [candidate division KSB1 bacterium]MDZ7366977.1 DUF4351 domain-containing protein [candidate division KSB1 bacterium]MDZ7406818.1 DUF4351 domain-containing protein [candidate division KSB1 bacterium]